MCGKVSLSLVKVLDEESVAELGAKDDHNNLTPIQRQTLAEVCSLISCDSWRKRYLVLCVRVHACVCGCGRGMLLDFV